MALTLKSPARIYGRFKVWRDGFWYVDIPRTGSTSLRTALGEQFGRPHGKWNTVGEAVPQPQIVPDHLTAEAMRSILTPFVWQRIFTFSIVRHPSERIYSFFQYRKRCKQIPDNWQFGDYLQALEEPSLTVSTWNGRLDRMTQKSFLFDRSGTCLVKFVGRAEDRQRCIDKIANSIGSSSLNLKQINSSANRKTHCKIFTPDTSRVIAKLFAEDFEYFSYDIAKH